MVKTAHHKTADAERNVIGQLVIDLFFRTKLLCGDEKHDDVIINKEYNSVKHA